GLKFDATPIIDARAELLDIERDYPKMAADENVPTVIEQIDKAFAGKLLDSADFYQRTGEPRAAAYFYAFLIDTYSASPEAAEARKRYSLLPASAKNGPKPPRANGFAPATQPIAEAR